MRNALLLLIIIQCAIACHTDSSGKGQQISLKNTSSVALDDKPVAILRKSLQFPGGDLQPVLITAKGDTIPSQLDDIDGDGQWDELFFVVDLKANESANYQVRWVRDVPRYVKRTSVRFGVRQTAADIVKPAISDTFYADQLPGVIGYQHYQTDGPTWENDKVAFRSYLDGRNSIDVFGKKGAAITPEDVGIGKDGVTENNYSVMKDWGTDILAVANSAGIGGFSLAFHDSLPRLGIVEGATINNVDSTVFRIGFEGPVRSAIQYRFINWRPVDRRYQVQQTATIWPGIYGFQNTVSFNGLRGDEEMVVSLVNSNTSRPLAELPLGDNWVVLYTHDKQTVNKDGWLGLALVLPRSNYNGFIEAPKKGNLSSAFLAKLKITENQPLSYFAIAAWEGTDAGFRNPDYFKRYLQHFVEQLGATVTVDIAKP